LNPSTPIIKTHEPNPAMNLISPERAAHWYRATDQGIVPYYEMRGKNGKMRVPKIDDARELGLLVSISRIASTLPKPALNAWLQSQAIISALTLPRLPNEPTDAFAQRVVADMDAQSQVALQFGSRIHAQIEQELIGQPPDCCLPDLEPFMVHVRTWIAENVKTVMGAEQIVGDLGFGIGGKLDLFCELNMPGKPIGIIDFKTQGVKNGKANFYNDWPIQLAGYGYCVKEKGAYEIWPQLISVVVDSKTPGLVHVKNWGDPESYWEVFLHCLEIFCYVNNYRPGKTVP
jgi:hypothetical protein